jgi:hypothetical protein
MMKTIIILSLLLQATLLWSQQDSAQLSILATPQNVEVRLNSVVLGSTPLLNLQLSPGIYQLEAIAVEPGMWYNTNISKEIQLHSGQDTTIYFQFPIMVKINSIPFHSQLLHENHLIGLTPIFIDFDKFQGKELSLENTGYKSSHFILTTSQSQLVTLEPIKLTEYGEENNSFTYSLFHTRIKSKFLFLTGSVVSHWLAFYFKNLADDNYSRYMTTGNPQLMQRYWDNTQKYDRWSDISLGVSYACLGGLIYTVLWR